MAVKNIEGLQESKADAAELVADGLQKQNFDMKERLRQRKLSKYFLNVLIGV
jgi:hypothetical protein